MRTGVWLMIRCNGFFSANEVRHARRVPDGSGSSSALRATHCCVTSLRTVARNQPTWRQSRRLKPFRTGIQGQPTGNQKCKTWTFTKQTENGQVSMKLPNTINSLAYWINGFLEKQKTTLLRHKCLNLLTISEVTNWHANQALLFISVVAPLSQPQYNPILRTPRP